MILRRSTFVVSILLATTALTEARNAQPTATDCGGFMRISASPKALATIPPTPGTVFMAPIRWAMKPCRMPGTWTLAATGPARTA